MSSNQTQRGGYVLVLTLGLLTLTAISLASLARYSLGLASTAKEAADDLQRRWGLWSVQHVFMERAAEFLDATILPDATNTPPWPKSSSVAITFSLGGQKFSCLVADEDAKANLNLIYARKPDRIQSSLRHLISDHTSGDLIIQLTPEKSGGHTFSSWGQVFNLANTRGGRKVGTGLSKATRQITCWGSGRLNLRRATETALREIASLALPAKEVGELLELRKHWGGGPINELLAELDLRRPQLLAASRLFANESRHYSLWIEIDNGQRQWSYQYVDDSRPVCFAW